MCTKYSILFGIFFISALFGSDIAVVEESDAFIQAMNEFKEIYAAFDPVGAIKKEDPMPFNEAEYVLSQAPARVSNLPQNILTKDMKFRPSYNCLTLLGEPGAGKSTIATAIAVLTKWDTYRVSQHTLLKPGAQRNSSTVELVKVLDAVESRKKEAIIIFDEMNVMMEHYDSPHHDTDALTEALLAMFDKNKKNSDVFFIATMNRIDRIPQTLQSRIGRGTYKIEALSTPEAINECLIRYLRQSGFILSEEVEEYAITKFNETGLKYRRDIEETVHDIHYIASDSTKIRGAIVSSDRIILPEHVDEAIEHYKSIFIGEMKYGQVKLSDEERRYREQLNQNKEQFEAQMAQNQRQFEEQKEIHQKERAEDTKRWWAGFVLSGVSAGAAVASAARGAETLTSVVRTISRITESAAQVGLGTLISPNVFTT